MESFRALVNEYFFAATKQPVDAVPVMQRSWESQSLSLVTKIQRQLRVTEALCGKKTPTFDELQAVRSHQLEQEEGDLQQAALEGLLPLIRSLRALEHSRVFHSQLHDNLRTSGLCVKYTTTNFAYGSTPFSTWRRVCEAEPLQRVARLLKHPLLSERDTLSSKKDSDNQNDENATARIATPCVIFGSSTGSLVFFTTKLLGLPTTGVEIVPFLHHVASELGKTHGLDQCQFLNCDMLSTQLGDTRVVVLTSLCWDEGLYAAVQEQLARQLSPGALVIDYRDGLLRGSAPQFALVHQLQGLPVSWHQEAQCISILEKL
ncbi:hypothetical protein PINS_up002197 [Pythium insidiosum]|nr:hypothetical protein PINS_up002197 [Pythium insidiosum]